MIFLIIAIFRAITNFNKKYRWYENIEVIIRSFKIYWLYQAYFWFMIGFLILLMKLNEIIPKEVWNQKYIWNFTIANMISFNAIFFIIGVFIYMIYFMFKEDKGIIRLKKKYGIKEKENGL